MFDRLKFEFNQLINMMLDLIPVEAWRSQTTTFLDPSMAGGQIVNEIEKRLKYYGHSNENISKRVFGLEENNIIVNYAINRYSLVGKYAVSSSMLNLDSALGVEKFDYIVSYPTIAKNNHPVYPFVYNSCSNLISDAGLLIFATPTKILEYIRLGSAHRKHINKKKIVYFNCDSSLSKFNLKGQLDFCYFAVSSKNSNINSMLPIFLSDIEKSIISKCFELKSNKYNGSRISFKNQNIEKCLDDNKHALFVNSIRRNGGYISDPIRFSDTIPDVVNKSKLLCSTIATGIVIDKEPYKLVANPSAGIATFITRNLIESENLERLFHSKLCAVFPKIMRDQGLAPFMKFIGNFKKVDLSLLWTDEMLFEHFELSSKEIDYIEATVR